MKKKKIAECKHDWEDLCLIRTSDGLYTQQRCRKCQKVRYVEPEEPDEGGTDGGKETK